MTESFDEIPQPESEGVGTLARTGADEDAAVAAADTAAETVAESASTARDGESAGFIAPVAMEYDRHTLFPGDQGTLDAEVRQVLVYLLKRRYISAERHPAEWKILLEHQPLIESRLHDLYVRLVIDHQHGLAYKQQVRADELEVPILMRDTPYTRAETLVLVHLRTIYQRETSVGEGSARVDIEDIEQTVLSYFVDEDGSVAKRQKKIRSAIEKLLTEGIITEDSEGRYLISPLIEVVLKAETLVELRDWLRERALGTGAPGAAVEASDSQNNESDFAEVDDVADTADSRDSEDLEETE